MTRSTEPVTLPPIRSSAAIEAKLRKRLNRLIVQMNNSVVHWIKAQWRETPPEMAFDDKPAKEFPQAQAWNFGTVANGRFTGIVTDFTANVTRSTVKDKRTFAVAINGKLLKGDGGLPRRFASITTASEVLARELEKERTPSENLERAVKDLRERWETKFADMSEKFAEHFAEDVEDRVDGQLKKHMKDAGWTVKMTLTDAQRDVLQATVAESVSLIKSIPSKYFDHVESMVQRSVQYGRDLGRLSKDLQKQFGVSKRRAAFIARDQNNKATAALTRTRQVQLGITEAIWVHSSAGKVPRPTHVVAGKKKVKYDPAKGWYDPHEKRHIFPGELINCRCFSRSVIPGFEA